MKIQRNPKILDKKWVKATLNNSFNTSKSCVNKNLNKKSQDKNKQFNRSKSEERYEKNIA